MAKLAKELEPEEGRKVQTGEEEIPTTTPGEHSEDVKAIYKKARENRALVTREDSEENPDVDEINKMVAEAADEGEFEHIDSKRIDTEGRADRFAEEGESDDPNYVESAKPTDDPPHVDVDDLNKDDQQNQNTVIDDDSTEKQNDLDYEAVDGMVTAKIYGKEFEVPVEDVIEAGSLKLYQVQRASNQKLELAATQARALKEEREGLEKLKLDAEAKKEPPATGAPSEEAEFKKEFKEKFLDAAFDGTDEQVDAILEEGVKHWKAVKEKAHPESGKPNQAVSDGIVEGYEQQHKLERAEANRVMLDEFPDVIDDEDLKLIAHRKYVELDADPSNFGRTASQMVREAGRYAQSVARRGSKPADTPHIKELETRREKKRVLPQSSDARSKSPAPEKPKTRSNKDFIRALRKVQGNQS